MFLGSAAEGRRGCGMRKNVVVMAVVSLIVGAFIATMLPVQAHHSDRALKSRLRNLEFQMSEMQNLINDCFYTQGISRFNDYRSVSGSQITALDVDTTTAPQYLMLALRPECAGVAKQISNAGKVGAARHH